MASPPARSAPPPPAAGRYFVQTFGCQMNVHDTERMEEVLVAHGLTPASSPDAADLIILNTCSVREKAEHKLRSEAGKLARLKRSRPDLVLCVAGCVAQQEGEKLLQTIDDLDLVVGPDNLAEIPALFLAQRAGELPVARTVFDTEGRFLAASPRPGAAPASAFVTTMKGCDERCSFCVVPYTRGPERYRPAADVVREVAAWVAAGSREVVLLGQTVDSFRDPALPLPDTGDPDDSQFPALLRLLDAEVPRFDPRAPDAPGLARLRYTSPHPRHATLALARAHAELDVLARHVHLPVQSGSDRMLRRMIRRYTRAEYVARAGRLARARPGLTLSTDIIVGFPGETEDDFEATLSLVREVGFTSVFAFKFSPRPHTPALKLADDVPEEVKQERLARLFELTEAQQGAHLASLVGSRQTVLVESVETRGERGRVASGRSERNEIVHFPAPQGKDPVGRLVEANVTRAYKHSLAAELTEESAAALPASPAAPRPAGARHALPVLLAIAQLAAVGALVAGAIGCSKNEPAGPRPRAKLESGGVTWQVLDGTWKKEGDALVGSGGHVESVNELADGTIELDVEELQATGRTTGIGFRYSLTGDDPGRPNGYGLNLAGKAFNVFRGANDYWLPIDPEMKGFSPSSIIDDRKNHVLIRMSGQSFFIDANGASLMNFTDPQYARGRVSLWVESTAQLVRFSNIHVKS